MYSSFLEYGVDNRGARWLVRGSSQSRCSAYSVHAWEEASYHANHVHHATLHGRTGNTQHKGFDQACHT